MNGEAQNKPSNWGRWGATDERGALNLLTPEMIKQAAGLVKTGKVYSLSMPLEAEGPQWPQRYKTWRVTTFRNPPNERGGANDVVTMHSHSGTHMDALCHIWYDDQLYNGYRASDHVTSSGATRNGIHDVVAVCADNHAVEAFDTMPPAPPADPRRRDSRSGHLSGGISQSRGTGRQQSL